MQILPKILKNCVDHTDKVILDWRNKCIVRGVEPLIISVDSKSDTESNENEKKLHI